MRLESASATAFGQILKKAKSSQYEQNKTVLECCKNPSLERPGKKLFTTNSQLPREFRFDAFS
jgi:hypothetical protein